MLKEINWESNLSLNMNNIIEMQNDMIEDEKLKGILTLEELNEYKEIINNFNDNLKNLKTKGEFLEEIIRINNIEHVQMKKGVIKGYVYFIVSQSYYIELMRMAKNL